MITEIIKIFLKSIKNNRILYGMSIVGICLYLLKIYNKEIYVILYLGIEKSGLLLIQYRWTLIVTIILMIIAYILLNKSNNEFLKKVEAHSPKIQFWESKDTNPIKVKVVENYTLSDYSREIIIFNELNEKIEYIRGRIDFYINSKRVFQVPFDIFDLEVYRSERISKKNIDIKNESWNEFNVFIEVLKVGNNEISNLKLFGTHFYKTHYLILNEYKYVNFRGKILLPYEISWLRNLSRSFINRIMWHFSIKRVYSTNKKEVLKDRLKNLFRVSMSMPLVILVVYFILKFNLDLINFFYDFIRIWLNSFYKILKSLYTI